MISIVVCTRTSHLPTEVKLNVEDTIGCKFELVEIDNSGNKYSIFEAYNEGVSRSTGNVLCFMHEDVLFRSQGWGATIEKHFRENEEIGLIGFAGTHFLPDTPMYWTASPFVSQRNLNNDQGIVKEHFHEGWFGDNDLIEVVAVDGFCFFVKNKMFDRISFDAKTYKGFHLYDMDICMQVIEAGYKVCVCRDILIEHCWSEKKMYSKQGSELFLYNLGLFTKKWKGRLPIHRGLQLPTSVYKRVNNLCKRAYMGENTHKSKEYRIGYVLLHPFEWMKNRKKRKMSKK